MKLCPNVFWWDAVVPGRFKVSVPQERAEVTVDQAHRGYSIAEDGVGYGCLNPLYIRNKPDSQGESA
eukprot:3789144-Amphidinium_carterae.1